MISLVEVLERTERYLRERGVDSPRLDAELLLCQVLGKPRLSLYLEFDRPMADAELETLRALVARRGKREPMAWILGRQGFHAIELLVGPGVLVPRPDTETLVDAFLAWQPAQEGLVYVADVGCGSGAIGLAVAVARPEVRVYATDVSPEALATTRANVAALGLTSRVAVLEGDLLSPIPDSRPIDWVLCNPPYIARRELGTLMPEVQHEPQLALDGGPDGLDIYRRLIPQAARRARQGVLVEVGHDQSARVMDLMRQAGLGGIETWKDLAGHHRVVGGRRA